ncbi:MAG TPA: DUF305 domain-containing protein [Actinoplanes sp.]|nr:DUF305 domain-containing protein [Actinoplanes sp.]
MVRGLARTAALILLVSGCGGTPAESHNATDVMFLQMSVAQIAEGDRVAQVVERRATGAELRAVATELRAAWRAEEPMMRGWLQVWGQPTTTEPATTGPRAGPHAGHGDLHALREEDFTALSDAEVGEFDRTATALLLGSLHNAMVTIRMQAAGGSYPQAVDLAGRMMESRQRQIARLLAV